MKILGIRIIWNRNYLFLVKFKEEVEDILRRKLPVILDKTLKNKNINLSRGLVMVNSTISGSNFKYRATTAINALSEAVITHNVFSKIN